MCRDEETGEVRCGGEEDRQDMKMRAEGQKREKKAKREKK